MNKTNNKGIITAIIVLVLLAIIISVTIVISNKNTKQAIDESNAKYSMYYGGEIKGTRLQTLFALIKDSNYVASKKPDKAHQIVSIEYNYKDYTTDEELENIKNILDLNLNYKVIPEKNQDNLIIKFTIRDIKTEDNQ